MENLTAKRWPFVESPDDFTERLIEARGDSINMLAAIRSVLINNPPTVSKEYLEMASGLGYCKMANACNCGGDTPEVRATCQNWIK